MDIISQVTGVGEFERVSRNAETIELFGHQCKVISVDDLILAKQAMGRDKDIATIKELRVIQAKRRG